MSTRKKKPPKPPVARARKGHARQRQHLIDACISALHLHGPSRTTVARVVAIAKMSPGIVRFYFDSKAAMLVAALQFLAAEFEERVLVPVTRQKAQPVAALTALVELYLDADIASPRKVSVWYAFWGEASSRQEYYDICGQKDERFAALVRELVDALIAESGRSYLDADGVTLGLIGALEILWQDIAFQVERDIDRSSARRRCMAFLAAIFPGQFAATRGTADAGDEAGVVGAGGGRSAVWLTAPRFAASTYGSARVFAAERDTLLHRCWAIAGHEAQLHQSGDFFTADIGGERALLVRDVSGAVRALRNSCPESPHTLVAARAGRFERTIGCTVHGLRFELDGRRVGAAAGDLAPLDLWCVAGLLFVRSAGGTRLAGESRTFDPWVGADPVEGLELLRPPWESIVAADWKVVVEQWLELAPTDIEPNAAANSLSWTAAPPQGGWSSRLYRRGVGGVTHCGWRTQFLAPYQLIETRPDGLSVLQAIGIEPGRCLLRRLDYTVLANAAGARAVNYLAQRLAPYMRGTRRALAESVQRGMTQYGYARDGSGPPRVAVTWLRQFLAIRVPALGTPVPSHDADR